MNGNSTQIMGRSLPHDDAAEKSVLGAVLLNSEAFQEVSDILTPSDFYHLPHQELFQAISQYKSDVSHETLDTVVLFNYLREQNLLEKCGGAAYIASLTNDISTSAQAKLYAEIVKKNALRRSVINACSQCQQAAMEPASDIYQTIDDFEQKMNTLSNQTGAQAETEISVFMTQAFKQLRDKIAHVYVSDTVPSGFEKLDAMMDGGFHPTDYIIVAARPSIGKTAFALSMIRNMVVGSTQFSVAFFSLEMSGIQISQRLLSAESKVPLKRIRQGRFVGSDDALQRIVTASTKLSDSKLYIYDTPNMKLTEIRSAARKLKRERNIQAMFIDYIGLIDSGLDSTTPRFEQVAYVSRNLKALARELQIPVIVLCQVNREAEDNVKEPQLNNLRDSGAIEQDADIVMFIHRNRRIDTQKCKLDENGKPTIQIGKVIVAKQRNGETGPFPVAFKYDCGSFENTESEYEPEEGDSAPRRGKPSSN
jgi:replicative DNA helicase